MNSETVDYIAALARLHLDSDEKLRFAKDLEDIVGYVETLNEVDVTNVKPTSHVLNVENVFRDDVVKPSLSNDEALSFSVQRHDKFYKVPKVIE